MAIQPGQPVLVTLGDGKTFLLRPRPGHQFSTHHGQIDFDELLEGRYGDELVLSTGKKALLLRPTVEDLMMKVERATNIVYPKDAGILLLRLGVRPGARVLEVGCGSGSLTIALATYVGAEGEVHAFDKTPRALEQARRNLQRAGLDDRVRLTLRDPGTSPLGPEEGSFHCAVCDIPEPWVEAEHLWEALEPGGRLACLNPTYNQIERTAVALEAVGFQHIDAMETLFRWILPRPGRTRPAQQMVGHTEFLLFAVRGAGRGPNPAAATAPERSDES